MLEYNHRPQFDRIVEALDAEDPQFVDRLEQITATQEAAFLGWIAAAGVYVTVVVLLVAAVGGIGVVVAVFGALLLAVTVPALRAPVLRAVTRVGRGPRESVRSVR